MCQKLLVGNRHMNKQKKKLLLLQKNKRKKKIEDSWVMFAKYEYRKKY